VKGASAPGPTAPARARQGHLLRAALGALAGAGLALWLVTHDQEVGRERAADRDGFGTAEADAPSRSPPPVARAPASPAEASSGAAGDAASATSGAGPAAEPAASSATGAAEAGTDAPAAGAPATVPPADAPAAPDAAAEAAAMDESGRDGKGGAPGAEASKDDGPKEGAAPRPSVAPAPLGRGYMVQLGVFSELDNALRLRDELAAQGYPANVQSRVVLGPFSDRQAAASAQARVRGERRIDGVIVPPRKR
jgi:DedD protein